MPETTDSPDSGGGESWQGPGSYRVTRPQRGGNAGWRCDRRTGEERMGAGVAIPIPPMEIPGSRCTSPPPRTGPAARRVRLGLRALVPTVRRGKQSLVPPDLFRLRYRQALARVIVAIVRRDEAATEHAVRGKIPTTVPLPAHEPFVQLVSAEFKALHPGNAVRFGIRPLELAAWQEFWRLSAVSRLPRVVRLA